MGKALSMRFRLLVFVLLRVVCVTGGYTVVCERTCTGV